MTAPRERPFGVDMPQVCILVYGAALAAPLVLFGILIWTGLERQLEFAAKERLVRNRIMQPRLAPSLTLVALARSTVVAMRPRGRTAA